MRSLKKCEVFGSEDQKQREEHGIRAAAVLKPEDNGQDQAVDQAVAGSLPTENIAENGRPPKPSEDAEMCPNWEKGRLRSSPYFRCQGWATNGHETCCNCYRFSQNAPIFRSVSLETATRVLQSARAAFEGVIESFKETRFFKNAWAQLADVVKTVQSEHENRGRDYSSHMQRVEALVGRTLAEEANYLLSKCESPATKKGNGDGGAHDSFDEWEGIVKKESENAEINGVYPHWLFAGRLRYLYRYLVQRDGLNQLAESIQQGPRRNGGNGGGGWNVNNSYRPRR